MRKFAPKLLLLALTPLMAGCFGLIPTPLPETPAERQAMEIRGVVLSGGNGEQVEYEDVNQVQWNANSVSIVGTQRGAGSPMERTFQFNQIESVLVRALDAGKTSGIVGGVIVGAVAVLMFIVNNSDPNAR